VPKSGVGTKARKEHLVTNPVRALGFVTLILGGLALSSPARALGGEQFVSMCGNEEDPGTHGFCMGYVFAVAEALDGLPEKPACLKGTTPRDLLDTVLVYVANHPDEKGESAAQLTLSALEDAFPCQ
jgi:hypothetical protein